MGEGNGTRQRGYYWFSGMHGPEVGFWSGREWLVCLAAYPGELNVLTGPIQYDGPLRLTDESGFI